MTAIRCRMRTTRLAAALSACLALSAPIVNPANALTVFDPLNYSQNILTAAHTLEQINNQIISLQHQRQMLLNEARNLASLPQSSLQQLQQSTRVTQQLLGQAQRITYDVQEINRAFSTTYGAASISASDQSLIDGARQRWRNSVAAHQDALKLQAGIVGNIDASRATMASLVTSSQTATGSLQATQAGNQLLALQSQQLSDLTAVVTAQGRAQSIEAAQRAAAQEQGREQLRRFIAPGQSYQPGNARMFH